MLKNLSTTDFNDFHEEINKLNSNKILTQELYKALEKNPGQNVISLLFHVARLKYGLTYGPFNNTEFLKSLQSYNNIRESEKILKGKCSNCGYKGHMHDCVDGLLCSNCLSNCMDM